MFSRHFKKHLLAQLDVPIPILIFKRQHKKNIIQGEKDFQVPNLRLHNKYETRGTNFPKRIYH